MPRFQQGNTAAAGNRGGGRPTNRVRDLANQDAPKIWNELMAVAFDPAHRQYRKHAFAALKTLATLAFPRPQAVSFDAPAEADGQTIAIRLLAERAAQKVAERQQQIDDRGLCRHCNGLGISSEANAPSSECKVSEIR